MKVVRRRSTREAGQALVEFVVAVPIILVLVLATLDMGRVVWANAALGNAAREGARYAIVRGGSPTSRCPVGPPAATASVPAASSSCPYPSPSKQAIEDTVVAHAIAGGSNIDVTVCYGVSCGSDVDATGATNARGTPVTVRVTSSISLVTGALLGMGPFAVSSQSTMVVSH